MLIWVNLELSDWLEGLELKQYLSKLVKQEYTLHKLANVDSEATLADIGISAMGHRIKMLRACKELRGSAGNGQSPKYGKGGKKKKFHQEYDAPAYTEADLAAYYQEFTGEKTSMIIGIKELEFTEKIGSGGAARVYKGLLRGKFTVAIKVMKAVTDPEILTEFKKEVAMMRFGLGFWIGMN